MLSRAPRAYNLMANISPLARMRLVQLAIEHAGCGLVVAGDSIVASSFLDGHVVSITFSQSGDATADWDERTTKLLHKIQSAVDLCINRAVSSFLATPVTCAPDGSLVLVDRNARSSEESSHGS